MSEPEGILARTPESNIARICWQTRHINQLDAVGTASTTGYC